MAFGAVGATFGAIFGAGVGGVAGGGVGYAVGHKIGGLISRKAKKKLDTVDFEGTEMQERKKSAEEGETKEEEQK